MKKLIPCLLGCVCLLAACSKKDQPAPEEKPAAGLVVSRLFSKTDTTDFMYDAEGMLKKFRHRSLLLPMGPDSTQVVLTGGRVTALNIWAMGELEVRSDRSFQYNTDGSLARISYYNMVSETELAITDYDSLVYKQGKLAEYYIVNGGQRNELYRLTWEKDNVARVDYAVFINGEEVPYHRTNITYNDKPALGRSFPGWFLFFTAPARDFANLGANEPVKAEMFSLPGEEAMERSTYEYTYNEKGHAEKIAKRVVTLPDGTEQETVPVQIEYTSPQ
jgi:hypothetical protein